jgi:NAD(P)-dependent dehydrogenase (short-subunit alcohol dehydrogenase family)
MIPRTYFDLSGRITLVTGASSGLGRHFALRFAAAGAKVVAAARRMDRLEDLAQTIRDAGGHVLPVAMDVEDEASIQSAYDAAERAFGTVDVVIANAGISGSGTALTLERAALAELMRINVEGVYLTAREGARRLIAAKKDDGRIILVASIGALRPLTGLAAYAGSKAAVAMMGQSFAREWARHGINVNTICPGYVATEMNSDWFETDGGQKLIKSFPRRRLMKAVDLGGLTLFLASDAAVSITGGVYVADDGQSLSGV